MDGGQRKCRQIHSSAGNWLSRFSGSGVPVFAYFHFANHANDPGNEVWIALGTKSWQPKRIMGRQVKTKCKHGGQMIMLQAITLGFLRYLQRCGSASLSPIARIHNGLKFGRKSAGSSVSTDY